MISVPPRLIQSAPKEMSAFPSMLRPRGLADHCEKRVRFPMDGDPFASCNSCNTPLSGCLRKARGFSDAYLLTCGHVICKPCVQNMRTQSQPPRTEGPYMSVVQTHFWCPGCRVDVTDILLPNERNANAKTCLSCLCQGEAFCVPNLRCKNCSRSICDECQADHNVEFPKHEIVKMDVEVIEVNSNRHFLGCKHHEYRPLVGRCKCGEMVCDQCLTSYNTFYDHGFDCTRITHEKKRLDEANLDLEESLFYSISLNGKLKSMLQFTQQKQEELAERVDRTNNEIACHFNQIILQAINRCWESMQYVKKQAGIHYERLNKHQRDLLRVERQIKIGLELDERGRDRRHVKPESVSQLIRHFSYSLTEPAIEELTKLEDFQSKIEMFEPVIVIHYETKDILNKIQNWGKEMQTNVRSLRLEMVHQPPTKMVEMVNMDGEKIYNICLDGVMDSSEIPIRVHSALDHFEDLYQKRFGTPSVCKEKGGIVTYEKMERMFSLGLRLPEEAYMTEKEKQDRRAYDISVRAKPGVLIMAPKVIGGIKKVFNLRKLTMAPKQVCTVFKRMPTPGPIWYPDGALNVSEGIQQNKQTGASRPDYNRPSPLRLAESPVKEEVVEPVEEEKPPVEKGTHRSRRKQSMEVLEDVKDFDLPSTSTQMSFAPSEVIDNRPQTDIDPEEETPSTRFVIREVTMMADAFKEQQNHLVKQTQNELAMENTMQKKMPGWGRNRPLLLNRASERPPQPSDSPIVIPRGHTINRTGRPSMQISQETVAGIQTGKISVAIPISKTRIKPYKLLESCGSDGSARTSIQVIYPIKDSDGNIISHQSTDSRTQMADLIQFSHPSVRTSRDDDGPTMLFDDHGATEETESRSPSSLMARSAMVADNEMKIEKPDDPDEPGPSAPKRSRK